MIASDNKVNETKDEQGDREKRFLADDQHETRRHYNHFQISNFEYFFFSNFE